MLCSYRYYLPPAMSGLWGLIYEKRAVMAAKKTAKKVDKKPVAKKTAKKVAPKVTAKKMKKFVENLSLREK